MSSPNLHEHYFALGLSPGASPEEVRAAYRRLAKLYHPDKDSSLDAEVRYRQIRAAYEALMKKMKNEKLTSPYPDVGYNGNMGGSSGREWKDTKNTEHENKGEYDPFWYDVIYGEKPPVRHIPFSFAALPKIFMASLKELANAGVVLQTLIAALFISYAYPRRPMSYRILVWGIALVSGLAAVVLRYYVTPRRGGNFTRLAVIAYAMGVEVLVTHVYREKLRGGTVFWGTAFFPFLFAAALLILNPLGMFFDAVRDAKNHHKGRGS
ncbi:MAG: J domain-containing protein [Synergistaceae bacterium]|jgi:hypothetical protein|nr:J domain-containing protein [Synergistaceae bacterium]